jgi:hypothetical protein
VTRPPCCGCRSAVESSIAAIAAGSWSGKERDRIRSSGYVVHTLEAALWCVDRAAEFSDAVLLAANLADDADTVAAVTGQIAGALWGRSSIPRQWLDRLAWRDEIENRAGQLAGAEAQRSIEAPAQATIRTGRVVTSFDAGSAEHRRDALLIRSSRLPGLTRPGEAFSAS